MKDFEKNSGRYSAAISRNGICATVTYIPSEYFTARDIAFDSSRTITQAKSRYEHSLFIKTTVRYDGRNKAKNRKRLIINKSTATMFITFGNDTVKAIDISYENKSNFSAEYGIIAVFNRQAIPNKGKNGMLLIRDLCDDLGTIRVPLSDIMKRTQDLKG